MAVDIRATVTCSLGTLISGSIGDDYLQNNGLIRTRGSVVISGTITPAIGTVVTFSYTKGGVTRNIPRKLRVLSSFADPYRRTTSVELGCKLTYLADLRSSIDWTVFNDPGNSSYNEDDSKVVTLPIRASSVMSACLTELGISASSIPLTNSFSIGKFDFSAGYVSVLSDLLVSECFCGYLDYNEVLQVVNLRDDGGTGTVYTQANIIDHGPINSGQLPGEAVTVSYSTMKLKYPDPVEPITERERRNWERETSVSGPNRYYIGNRVFTGMETVNTEIQYTTIGDVDVPIRRESVETGSTAKVAGSIGTAYVQNGRSFNAYTATLRKEVETNSYDKNGNRLRTSIDVYESYLAFYGSVSLDYVFPPTSPGDSPTFVSLPGTSVLRLREQTVITYRRIGTAEQQTTKTYVAWLVSGAGQQAIAENRSYLTTANAVSNFITDASTAGMVLERNIVTINTRNTIPGRPSNTASASLAKEGDPANNYRQQSTAKLQLALGSGSAQRRIEFSMPYAPDDIFVGFSGGPFTVYVSDAPTKANNFGRVQNRLLLGNRNGMNIQLAPELLPAAPFAPMYVQANGLTAQYRANGNQWSFDSNGIVCSTDALFWAAVGGTGVFWFPVAPGVTTLPTTPPIVGGNITPGVTIPPYNETVEVRASAGPVIRVTSIPYSLQPQLTVLDRLALHSKLRAARINKVEIPAANITVAAFVPVISGSNTVVVIPAAPVAVAAVLPDVIGRPRLRVLVPAAAVSVAAPLPTIASGGSVAVPAAAITVAALTPVAIGSSSTDPSFSSVSLLLHMDGTNGSTTVLDNSPSPSTVTVYTDAALSTADSKFGSASAYFDGTGAYMTTPANANVRFGSGEFTIEGWFKRKGSCPTSSIICSTYTGSSVNFAVSMGDSGSTHSLRAGFYASGWNWIIDSVEAPLDEWIFFAYVRKGNVLSLYKNDDLVGTRSYTGSLPSAIMDTRIGRGWDDQRFFNGYIDEIRVTKGVGRYETGTGANANKMVLAGTNTLALPSGPFPDS